MATQQQKENYCEAIISRGNNIGQICNRENCVIFGHDRFNDGKRCCRQILKVGRNAGQECKRINCMFHPNIADFLELPLYFRQGIIHYDFAKILINNYKYCLVSYKNYDKRIYSSFIKIILEVFNKYPIRTKMLLSIYFIKLLDTPMMVYFRLNNKEFNNKVFERLEDFSNNNDINFSSYINTNFDKSKKRYLHKSKNRILLLRNYVLARSCFIKLYIIKKHKLNLPPSYCNIL